MNMAPRVNRETLRKPTLTEQDLEFFVRLFVGDKPTLVGSQLMTRYQEIVNALETEGTYQPPPELADSLRAEPSPGQVLPFTPRKGG